MGFNSGFKGLISQITAKSTLEQTMKV